MLDEKEKNSGKCGAVRFCLKAVRINSPPSMRHKERQRGQDKTTNICYLKRVRVEAGFISIHFREKEILIETKNICIKLRISQPWLIHSTSTNSRNH